MAEKLRPLMLRPGRGINMKVRCPMPQAACEKITQYYNEGQLSSATTKSNPDQCLRRLEGERDDQGRPLFTKLQLLQVNTAKIQALLGRLHRVTTGKAACDKEKLKKKQAAKVVGKAAVAAEKANALASGSSASAASLRPKKQRSRKTVRASETTDVRDHSRPKKKHHGDGMGRTEKEKKAARARRNA